MRTISLFSASLLIASSLLAQNRPADAPEDMEHMQHGGFMQGGMHHAVAKGVKLEQKIDGHTVIVRIGPMNLPANTSSLIIPDFIVSLQEFHARNLTRHTKAL